MRLGHPGTGVPGIVVRSAQYKDALLCHNVMSTTRIALDRPGHGAHGTVGETSVRSMDVRHKREGISPIPITLGPPVTDAVDMEEDAGALLADAAPLEKAGSGRRTSLELPG